ncbi:MAG TPA: nucleotide exchange factor GrpE [Solirubrobacteraceae bacterium]|nr:nucleotide exchange factor GrpE [Solirubrobacteraceae bacterium]
MHDEPTTAEAPVPTDAPAPGAPEPVAEAPTEAPPAAAPSGAPEDGAGEVDLGELTARAAERDEYLGLAQRTRADFENYRKRVTRDAAATEARVVGRLVRELLPAIDNLERALAASTAEPGDHLADGLRMVRDDLRGALTRAGVESFTPVGEPFDPELHEAIAQHVVAGATPGTVVEVYQAGYRLGDGLIRPARVVVAGAPPAEPAEAASAAGEGT